LAGAVTLAAGAALAQDKASKDDQKFIKTVIQHNYAEVDVGRLAQEKGQSQQVKDFGAKLVQDHGANNEKAKQLASQLGVEAPKSADMSHKAGFLKLKMLSGSAFDKAFTRDMVKDHQADVKEFQHQADRGSSQVSQFARDTLPTLQQHLQMAQEIQ